MHAPLAYSSHQTVHALAAVVTGAPRCRNLAEAARLAISKGTPGTPYFVTDGEHPDMEDFLTRLMETQVGRGALGAEWTNCCAWQSATIECECDHDTFDLMVIRGERNPMRSEYRTSWHGLLQRSWRASHCWGEALHST